MTQVVYSAYDARMNFLEINGIGLEVRSIARTSNKSPWFSCTGLNSRSACDPGTTSPGRRPCAWPRARRGYGQSEAGLEATTEFMQKPSGCYDFYSYLHPPTKRFGHFFLKLNKHPLQLAVDDPCRDQITAWPQCWPDPVPSASATPRASGRPAAAANRCASGASSPPGCPRQQPCA